MVVLAACGASSAQIGAAKAAKYAAPPPTIFELAKEAAAESYKIAEVDAATNRFVTELQFYNKEGGRQSAGAEGFVNLSAGSIGLELLVEVVPVEGLTERVAVVITPRVLEVVSFSPKPRTLAPDDPSMPGWVHGRVDALAAAIYERAKQYDSP
jgi:hypothetical protein